ncbi:MAG TPA: hypothetical protein VHO01_08530 [Jatrophihabitans sp.]|nr:hypothetical protein [Jatrophihabitans sp.]
MSSVVPPAPGAAPRGRRRLLRYVLPVAAAGVLALVASDVLSAHADQNLPSHSATELLAAASTPQLTGFSGTVVEKAALGLPELGLLAGGSGSETGALSLLTGSHTIRVWYGGEDKQRVAMLDALGESDVFRNGSTVWAWDSRNRVATRLSLPATLPAPPALASPDQFAKQLLARISPSTSVSTDKNVQVAGRSAYELVLTPKDSRSRVGQIRIAIDGKTMVPLALQVYARDSSRPAFDIAFTRFDTGMPTEDNFTWQPPAGVTIRQAPSANRSSLPFGLGQVSSSMVGQDWTTVLKLTGLPTPAQLAQRSPQLGIAYGMLPAVRGAWGSGRLLQSSLLTVLYTDDGRAFVGAVDPSVLYAAAAQR